MRSITDLPYRTVVVDLTEPLDGLLNVLADYCDEVVFTPQELLLFALTHLHFSFQHRQHFSYLLHEATETLMIEIQAYHRLVDGYLAILAIEDQSRLFLQEMLHQFKYCNLYDQDGELQYTFGGWVCDGTAYFIPRQAIRHFSTAIVSAYPEHPAPVKRVPFDEDKIISWL